MSPDELFGVRVVVSPVVPPGTVYVVGEITMPPEAVDWTPQRRAEYAVAHGAVVVVRDLAEIAKGLP